ncbi:MAG: hypothetical protein PVF19_06545 [Gemmatimonadota bacterium]
MILPTRLAAMRLPVRTLIAALAVLAPAAAAAQAGSGIRADAVHVFLDCNTRRCDSEYFRTEISFVNWVRDRTLAEVHLIITSTETGGGGDVYDLEFIGLEELEGTDDRLSVTTLGTDTEDEILAQLSRVIAAGLARYSILLGQPTGFDVTATDPVAEEVDRLVSGSQVSDPWNFWVFEISAELNLSGEETEKERRNRGQFEARRTTDTWKLELESDFDLRRDERELEDEEVIVDERSNWSVDGLVAYSLADHWSLGLLAGAGASTRRNQDFGADGSLALEYSFFSYDEAPRRSLTARYDFRVQYYDWEEETIFFETEEVRPQHELELRLFQRQPWGQSVLSLSGRQFLHDPGLWSVSLFGNLEFRVLRGLELEIRGGVDFIEDQIFISAEGLTPEEILLGRFDRPTDFSYFLQFGIGFEFGSIYNNVVNNRFD